MVFNATLTVYRGLERGGGFLNIWVISFKPCDFVFQVDFYLIYGSFFRCLKTEWFFFLKTYITQGVLELTLCYKHNIKYYILYICISVVYNTHMVIPLDIPSCESSFLLQRVLPSHVQIKSILGFLLFACSFNSIHTER